MIKEKKYIFLEDSLGGSEIEKTDAIIICTPVIMMTIHGIINLRMSDSIPIEQINEIDLASICRKYFTFNLTLMVELKYPRGWSFAATDSFEGIKGTAVQKYNAIQKQLKFRLDRDLYIQARTYSQGPVNGGIDRFIEGMRKGFSIDEILDGKYDGIIDTDPRNRIIPTTPMPEVELLNDSIEVNKDAGYETLEDMANDLGKSPSTIKRWKTDGIVIEVDGRYFLKNQKEE